MRNEGVCATLCNNSIGPHEEHPVVEEPMNMLGLALPSAQG